MRPVLMIIAVCIGSIVIGQQKDIFRSPVSYETRLSGSFAEPRSAHFHAGIDYKQKRGVPYDTIYAVADGYISRINVKPDGYGNALYINHPSGHTSVYAHLHHFNDELKKYISDILISKRQHKIEHYPTPDMLKVKQGDYIGIMGNTGRSFGAHLHFEIRKTDSETPINPSFFNLKPNDNLRPTIRGIMIYNLTPNGKEISKTYYPALLSSAGNYILKQSIVSTDCLTVGIGIHAYDTMNGASNHNGVYGVTLKNNQNVVYQFKMDSISFAHSRYIHSHMDYEAKKNNRYVSKCFKTDINPLAIYDSTQYNGRIITSDIIPNKISIDVFDFEGNKSTISFSLSKRVQSNYPAESVDSTYQLIYPTDSFSGSTGAYSWESPPGLVDKPEYISTDSRGDTIIFRTQSLVPTFEHIKITYQSANKSLNNKALVAYKNDNGKMVSLGGKQVDSTGLITFTNKLETYWIDHDTIPPKIRIISLPNKNNSRLKFVMSDNFEPAYSRDQLQFELFIDDEWKLCQHDIKDNSVWHDVILFEDQRSHDILIKVSDSRNNQSIAKRTVIY